MTKEFLEWFGPCIAVENVDQKMNFSYDSYEFRLDFLFIDLSQTFGTYLVVFAVK